jgi:hypothetical protein
MNAFEATPNVWMLRGGRMLQVTTTIATGKSCASWSGMVKSNQHKVAMWNGALGVIPNAAIGTSTPWFRKSR